MSAYNSSTHSSHVTQNPNEGLQEIPEDSDFLDSQFSIGFDNIDGTSNYSSENIVRWFEQGENDEPPAELKAPTKSRRRVPPGPDHVKHRRTRSGCYTCRSRRVKCDETHPTCDRCRKGSRECTWPPETTSKPGSSGKGGKNAEQVTGSSEEDDDDDEELTPKDEKPPKETITESKGRNSLTSLKISMRKQTALNSRRSTDQFKDKSISPCTTEGTRTDSDLFSPVGHQSTISTNTSQDDAAWSRLKQDHQFYLNYHQRAISYCYYFLKQDLCNFTETMLIDAALTYEPLLYAVVGFSAFHYALVHQGKKISAFLAYYNKGVSLLRQDLSSGKPYTDAMIYTVLQLATFEEYMGDWANLMIHQKAACEMLRVLYTPESMMQTEASRTLFTWYIRFDIFVGFMAGSETMIGLEWFEAYQQHTETLAAMDPSNIHYHLEALNAENRVLGMHMAILFAKLPKGEITVATFLELNRHLLSTIMQWADKVNDLKRTHADYLVQDFGRRRELALDDIVDPFEPGKIFGEALFTANYMMMDCMALIVMHKMQTATILQQQPPAELTELSVQQCQIFASMQEYEHAPSGSFLPAQVNIGLICFFIPREPTHISWCQKMLNRFECSGYIYPPSFRAKVAEGWSMPSIKESWLPNDDQQPPIIKELRSFVTERTTKPQTQLSEDIRAMKAILEKLNLEESPKTSPDSSSSPSDGITSPVRGGSVHQMWSPSPPTSHPRHHSGPTHYEGSSHGWT